MLINLRNALMAGKRLPYDSEVEFLESDGNAYAVVPNNIFSKHIGLRVELTLSTGSATLSAVSVLLAAGGNIQGPPYYYRVAIDKTAQFASPGVNWFSLFTDGNVHTVSTTNASLANTGIYTNTDVDGTRVLRNAYSSANKTFDDTVGIFAFNNGNNKCPAGIRIYSIVACDENGNKTADFIPVRKGTVGYLYDRVSGALFGNAGTGDFVLGQDVVPVEWLESHGTEWIDTGVNATGATDSEFQFKMSVAGFAFGARTAWNAYAYSLNYAAGNYAFNYGNNGVVADLKTSIQIDTNWHTAKIQSGGVLSLDEWTDTAGTFSFTTNGSLILFGTRQGSSLNLTASGFKYCKIWGNSLPVRSFRPVRVGTEGAMMDTLTRRIYRNAGTGAFGYGNDLKYPIPA